MIELEFDRALSIGINYVGSSAQLNGCVNDVINLSKNIRVKHSHVKLTELAESANLLPTRQNIINAIKQFTSEAKEGEKLLFQYSGHGSYTRDTRGRKADEKDGKDETIVPVDYATSGDIKDDDLRVLLCDSLPKSTKLWCIFDCCHSGTILDLPHTFKVFPGLNNKRKYKSYHDKNYQDTQPEVVCFSGCLDHQYSADAYINRQYQGAMTWALCVSIRHLRQRKLPVTYRNIMKRMLRVLRSNKYQQVPQISTGQAIDLNTKWF